MNVSIVVTRSFGSPKDSLEHFHSRNAQYLGFIDLIPASGQNKKVVVDYGCGQGNDLVDFTVSSKSCGMDVSAQAIPVTT